jgi:ABC-2 type transport system permease protein
MTKYWILFKLELNRFWLYKWDQIASALLLVIRLILPSGLLFSLQKAGQIGLSEVYLGLWAIAFGQVFRGAAPRIDNTIKNDIRTGLIQLRLSEPISYIGYQFSKYLASSLASIVFLSVIILLPLSFIIPVEFDITLALFISLLGLLLHFNIKILVGLSSFVMEENEGVVWIVNKLFLIFGNQIIPVFLLPVWFFELARCTPFYLVLAAPIDVASGRVSLVNVIFGLIVYILLTGLGAHLLFNQLQKKLIFNG